MTPHRPQLASNVRDILAALRRRIRRYVWLEGIATALTWLGAAFWASLAVDWFFEPPRGVRGLALAAVAAGLVWVLVALIFRRLLVRMTDANMAMLLERRFPQFGDSLLTAVELTEREPDEGCNLVLLSQTCDEAAQPAGQVRLEQVFNPLPLRRATVAAVLFAISIVMFGAFFPAAMGVWARRTLGFSTEIWPRRNQLEIVGFQDGVARIAKGTDLDLVVRADLLEHAAPEVVQVVYRESGSRSRKPMNREGVAGEDDPFQEYSYNFRSVLAPVHFDVVGGDASVRGYRIEVVDNPTIVNIGLDCEYPKYMDRAPRSFAYSSLMQFPMGSRITLRATANKELVRVQVDLAGDTSKRPQILAPSEGKPQEFEYAIKDFSADTTLLFTLFDTDGIKSREPVRVALSALEDQRPEFTAQLRGIGPAVTPKCRIPAVGRVTDDYGLARIWYEHAIDQGQPAETPIAKIDGIATDRELKREILDVEKLALKPGQKLQVCLKAEDRYNLGKGPNVGVSDRWTLDIVTEQQLRTMLEARELVLRQRFESILRDVEEIRDTVLKIRYASANAEPAGEKPAAEKAAKAGEKSAEKTAAEKSKTEKAPPESQGQRGVFVQWAAQNSVKSAHEVGGVADAFADIREELANNQIKDIVEVSKRLDNGIAQPLHRVAEEMFPEFDRRLDALQKAVDDESQGPEARAAALAQVDAILLEMRQVRDRMLQLEDFQEAVNILRSIIDEHKKVEGETKKQHKDSLRKDLE
jgi:hypothetical protein